MGVVQNEVLICRMIFATQHQHTQGAKFSIV